MRTTLSLNKVITWTALFLSIVLLIPNTTPMQLVEPMRIASFADFAYRYRYVQLVFCMILTWFGHADNAIARCGLLDPAAFVVNVAKQTGFSEYQLQLMPSMHEVYEDGILKFHFGSLPRPCRGPHCESLPIDDCPVSRPLSERSYTSSYLASNASFNAWFGFFSERFIPRDDFLQSQSDTQLPLRPPIA